MKPILIAGVTIVNLALIAYSIAIYTQNRKNRLTRTVMTFLTLGVIFDITSTVCMVISSGHALTLHGVVGYSSLAGMLIDTIISYRRVNTLGTGCEVTARFSRWSRVAYFYWLAAYVTGVLIISLR